MPLVAFIPTILFNAAGTRLEPAVSVPSAKSATPRATSTADPALERRGWVQREPCPEDGRYTNAILTDAGWDKVEASAPGHVEAVRRLVIDALTTTQLRHLRDIGRRILQGIDSDTGP